MRVDSRAEGFRTRDHGTARLIGGGWILRPSHETLVGAASLRSRPTKLDTRKHVD